MMSGKKEEILKFYQRIISQGYGVLSDGNISIRDNDKIYITPSGITAETLQVTDIPAVALDGMILESNSQPTTELPLHLEIYAVRKDISCVIHAHPASVLSLSLACISLEDCYLPETALYLGSIPTTPYATPSTEQGAQAVSELIQKTDTVILPRHGSVTVGKNLNEAYQRLVRLERTALVILQAFSVSQIVPLDKEQLQQIALLRKDAGISGKIYYKALEEMS